MTTEKQIRDAQESFKQDKPVPINQKPEYKAVQARLFGSKEKDCVCSVPLRRNGKCKKCKKKLR
jgi:hypothetical protein